MAKKIDLSGVKEFLFNHGEKVALGACGFLALVLGVMGLFRAMSAGKAEGSGGKSLADALKFEAKQVQHKLANPAPVELAEDVKDALKAETFVWSMMTTSHNPVPFINLSEPDGNKRYNPQILGIVPWTKEKPNVIKMDYVAGAALTHRVEGAYVYLLKPEGGGVNGGGANMPPMPTAPPPMGGKRPKDGIPGGAGNPAVVEHPFQQLAVPVRMVVVQAIFPMKQQVIEFQRAFKLSSQQELFMPDKDGPYANLPKPVGINVVRFELQADGKTPVNKDGEILVSWDGKKLTKSAKLDNLLKDAIYDEETPKALEWHLWEGLNMPMPIVKNIPYPKFNFDGFEITWGDDEVDPAKKPDPMVGGGKPPPPPIRPPGDPMGSSGLPLGGKGKIRPGGPMGDKMPPEMDPNKQGEAGGIPDGVAEKFSATKLKSADLALHDRLFKKPSEYNLFHVLGQFPPKDPVAGGAGDPKMPAPFAPPMPGAGMQGQRAEGQYFSAWHLGEGGGMGGPGFNGPGAPPRPMGPGAPPRPMGPGDPRRPMGPMGMPPGDGGGVEQAFPNWDRDALVRFIDPEVRPGRTYYYAIQVRMANPNYKKKELVAFAALANRAELESKWEFTPNITIPQEYHLYALDQQLIDDFAKGDKKKVTPNDMKIAREQTTFQIHQWVEKKQDRGGHLLESLVIGDWVVAERVSVRRGEPIGINVQIDAPVWYPRKNAFDLVTFTEGKGAKAVLKHGLKVDLKKEVFDQKTGKLVPEEAPVLVDFIGGKRGKINYPTDFDEESAVEALIMTPDGRLQVRNSRSDSDPPLAGPDAKDERKERVAHTRRRVEEVLSGPAPAMNGGPEMPKGGRPPMPGAKMP